MSLQGSGLRPLVWGVLRFTEVGGPDQHGDYQIANAAGLVIGPIILAIGLIGIGRWLRNEEPIHLPDPADLLPT